MTTEEKETKVVLRFVCVGRRAGQKVPIVWGLSQFSPAGEINEPKWYADDKTTRALRVGAVYDIPIGENGSLFLGQRSYVSRFPFAAKIVEWEAQDSATLVLIARDKQEKAEGTRNTALLHSLIPARRAYSKLGWPNRQAFELLVLDLLRSPVKANEEE